MNKIDFSLVAKVTLLEQEYIKMKIELLEIAFKELEKVIKEFLYD